MCMHKEEKEKSIRSKDYFYIRANIRFQGNEIR